MKIKNKQLKDLVIEVAVIHFRAETFQRRDLLLAVEEELHKRNLWEETDSLLSHSVDPKSRGLATIDFIFSDLSREGKLVSTKRNTWQVAPNILIANEILEKPQRNRIELIVEGSIDKQIVEFIFRAADIPLEQFTITSKGSKSNIKKWIETIDRADIFNYAILIDADELNVPDSKELARIQLGYPPFKVFCAVPTIEAWLFADDKTAERYAYSQNAKETLNRLPLPEQIPYPKQVAFHVFGRGRSKDESYRFLEEINIERAVSRSPSLRDFLTGVSDLINLPIAFESTETLDQSNQDIFVNLINEVTNSNTVLWKTTDGSEFTAQNLREEIEQGSLVGKQYIAEVLRIARDLLARQSRNK